MKPDPHPAGCLRRPRPRYLVAMIAAVGGLLAGTASFAASPEGPAAPGGPVADARAFDCTDAATSEYGECPSGPTATITQPADGATYAAKSTLTAEFECSDVDGPGIASCKGTVGNGKKIDTKKPGIHQFSVTAKDRAGITATTVVGYTVVADTEKPTITVTTPEDGGSYAMKSVALADYSCADEAGGSGIASCKGKVTNGKKIDTKKPGAHSFSVTAKDEAGNTTKETVAYTVTKP